MPLAVSISTRPMLSLSAYHARYSALLSMVVLVAPVSNTIFNDTRRSIVTGTIINPSVASLEKEKSFFNDLYGIEFSVLGLCLHRPLGNA
jgi:hypothetical protein